MPTPTVITSLEHASLSTNGGGLFRNITGVSGSTVQIQSTIKHDGNYALRFSGSALAYASLHSGSGWNYQAVSLYLYVHTQSLSDITIIDFNGTGTTSRLQMTGGSALRLLGGSVYNGPAISKDTWYLIDYEADQVNNTVYAQVHDDSGSPIGNEFGGSCVNIADRAYCNVGLLTASGQNDIYMDDIIIDNEDGVYPIGEHHIVALSPNADGTHNAGTNVMEDQAGNDIGVVTAWNLLSSIPLSESGSYVRQAATGTGNYAEVNYADTDKINIIGVQAELAYMAAGTQADNGGCVVFTSSGSGTLWGAPGALADYSESTPYYKRLIVPTPAGGWDASKVNGIYTRLGYSSDVNPVPYWLNLLLEVAYGSQTPVLVIANTASAQTCDNLSLSSATSLNIHNCATAQTCDNLTLHRSFYETLVGSMTPAGPAAYKFDVQETLLGAMTPAGALTATEHHILTIHDSTSVQTCDNLNLAGAVSLVIHDSSSAQTCTTPSLIQHSILSIQSTTTAQTCETPSLTQHNLLAIASAATAQTCSSPSLTQHSVLVINNAASPQASENVALVQHQVLVIHDSSSAQVCGALSLVQHHMLVTHDSASAQKVDALALAQHSALTIHSAASAQACDNLVLVSHLPGAALSIQSTASAQVSENVGLIQHNILAINSDASAQFCEQISLVFHPGTSVLTVHSDASAQTCDNLALVQHHVLAVADCASAQSCDVLSLTQHSVLAVAATASAQTCDNLVLTGHLPGAALTVHDCASANTCESLALVQHSTLTIHDCASPQVSQKLVFIVVTVVMLGRVYLVSAESRAWLIALERRLRQVDADIRNWIIRDRSTL